jgi:hypothetical protein
MKTIRPFNNTPTVVHVKELPPLIDLFFNFGYIPGKIDGSPTIRINVDLITKESAGTKQIKIATYNSFYEIKGEGLVLEQHIYDCCQQAIYAMKIFLQFHEIGKTIPQEIFQCPGKEAFVNDLVHLAKMLNAVEGKRKFPKP